MSADTGRYTHDLKALNTEKKKLIQRKSGVSAQIRSLESEMQSINHRIQEIEAAVASLGKNGEIVVSEHAILRYLERVEGLDLSRVRSVLLTDKVKGSVKALGNCKVGLDDCTVVVRNNTIVTVET